MRSLVAVVVVSGFCLYAQQPADTPTSDKGDERIMGVIPNYMTVSDPDAAVVPLTKKQKWDLFVRGSVDPYTFFSAALAAGFSQHGNNDPRYGNGWGPYGERFGAAMADFTITSGAARNRASCFEWAIHSVRPCRAGPIQESAPSTSRVLPVWAWVL
jgi:hypothetical protein